MFLDDTLMLWINQSWQHPVLDILFSWVSERIYFSYPLLAMLFFDLTRQKRGEGARLALLLLLTVLLGDMLGNYLKDEFTQPRPCFAIYEQLYSPTPCGAALTGMPSNHALNFFATSIFVTLTIPWRRWRLILWTAAILASLSRIYLGKHYPSQVLAGMSIGLIVGLCGAWLAWRLRFSLCRNA